MPDPLALRVFRDARNVMMDVGSLAMRLGDSRIDLVRAMAGLEELEVDRAAYAAVAREAATLYSLLRDERTHSRLLALVELADRAAAGERMEA